VRGEEGRRGEGKGHEPPPHYLEEVYAYVGTARRGLRWAPARPGPSSLYLM